MRYVDCSSSNKNSEDEHKLTNSINAALSSLDPSEDDTIYVKGACNENVNITGFDRLKLIAQNGATITDASGGTAAVVFIIDSTRVSLQGFTINGSSQSDGIDCLASNCSFSGNTVQGAADGVTVGRAWARASFSGDVIQDNRGDGIIVIGNAFAQANGVTTQRNGSGASVADRAVLQLINSTVQNNAEGIGVFRNGTANIGNSTVQNNAGSGISVRNGSFALISRTTITGNAGDGIDVLNHSTIQLGTAGQTSGDSITGNRGVGILVKDLSFAGFSLRGTNVVKNNLGAADVLCSPQFPATRGVTNIGGGTTNCVEP